MKRSKRSKSLIWLSAITLFCSVLSHSAVAENLYSAGELTASTKTLVSHQTPPLKTSPPPLPRRLTAENPSPRLWRKEAKRILHRLVGDDLHAFLGFAPELAILETPTLDAYVSSNGTLTVSHGMLVFLDSDSEFAFLIAHEVAHMMLEHHALDHSQSLDVNDFIHREVQADKLAMKLISEAGFSRSAALDLIARLGEFGRDRGMAMEEMYPSLKTRRLALQVTY